MKKHVCIILAYSAVSISGFIGLALYLYTYFGKLIENSDDLVGTIISISLYSLFLTELYLFAAFLIALIGYFISKYRDLDDYIKAFKTLSWIHLAIWIAFTFLCVISFKNS